VTAAAPSLERSVARTADHHRPDLQGLRAVAVGVVVLFHLWPNRLSGGYVGVDVFFVISGFLITSHLYREVVATGTVALRRFWARRIRRLLPASLLVLAVSLVAVYLVVPTTLWPQTSRQIGASALYVQNWALAADAVDYMAADNVPTLAQHYWSLSVEEQFYLVWPALILLLLAWHRWRGQRADRARVLRLGLGVVAVASLAASVVLTGRDQAQAYLVTQTRAWEFAAGALLALAPAGLGGRWRGPLAWAGLGAIAVASVGFTPTSLFPGWIALLPVLGTVAVIAGGAAHGRWSPRRLLSWRPATFVGDISYSVYLWHWPLIVVLPFVTGHHLTTVDKLAIGVATLALAAASKYWIEDPGRTRPLLAAAPWRAFAFAAIGMAVVVSGAIWLQHEVERRAAESAAVAAAARQQAEERGCFGPAALEPGRGCKPVTGVGPLVPPPSAVVLQNTQPLYHGCQAGPLTEGLTTCSLGSTDPGARQVALVGDSHATQWFSAFDELGKQDGFTVHTYTRSSCPLTTAVRVLDNEQTSDKRDACLRTDRKLLSTLASDPSIDVVVTAAYTTAYDWESAPGHPLADPRVDGFAQALGELEKAGKKVLVISDVPRTQGANVPTCLTLHPDDWMACAVPRAEALPGSALAAAVHQLDAPDVQLVDLTDRFCDTTWCYPVVGDVIVYRDYSHLSADYSLALVPDLRKALDNLLGD